MMRIEGHLEKIKRLENTMLKLDDEEDHETVVENCVLGAAHCINASLHKLGKLRIDRDIKHNLLEGHLKREHGLGEKSVEVSDLMGKIERLRPSHIYGSGRNGTISRIVKDSYFKIKRFAR